MTARDTLRTILVTLWAGGLVVIAAGVAPVLFALLPDRAVAGDVAGTLFYEATWFSLAAALVYRLLLPAGSGALLRRLPWAVAALLVVGVFGLGALMHPLRLRGDTGGEAFALLHGLSALLYMLGALGCVWLAVAERALPARLRDAEG
jgi:hypothetical protein